MKINLREKNNSSLKKDIFNLHICNKSCINDHIYIVKVKRMKNKNLNLAISIAVFLFVTPQLFLSAKLFFN